MDNSESKKRNEEAKLQVKNKFIYFGSVFDRYLSLYLCSVVIYSLNLFMDTISNKNNLDFTKTEREYYIGIFTSALYVGSALGSLLSGFWTRYDTRIVFALTKIGNSLALILFTYPDVRVMIFARFLMGFFYDASNSVAMWSLYEMLLPRHRQRAVTILYAMAGLCFFSCSLLAVYDDQGWLFWRLSFVIPALIVILWTLASFPLFPKINSSTYLVLVKGENQAFTVMKEYLGDETARFMIAEFQKNQIALSKNRSHYRRSDTRNEDGMVLSDTKNNENSDNLLEKKEMGGFCSDLKMHSTEAIHIIIFTVASMLSFHDTFYQFSVYYGAKNLNNQKAVTITKKFVIVSSVLKVVSCFVFGILNWTKKRKLCLLISHFATLILLGGICFGDYIEDLQIARYCLALAPLFTV